MPVSRKKLSLAGSMKTIKAKDRNRVENPVTYPAKND
jgi:hypothetical protein